MKLRCSLLSVEGAIVGHELHRTSYCSHITQSRIRTIPAATNACTIITRPNTVITAAEVNGNQRVMSRPSPWKRAMTCRADTIKRPIFFFFQAEDGIRDLYVTGVQTCALPI